MLNRISYLILSIGGAIALLLGIAAVEAAPPLQPAIAANCTIPAMATDTLLSMYVLAFDNPLENENSLASVYTETVDALVAATAANDEAIAVILADLSGYGDTHIIVAQAGSAEMLDCLPDPSGTMTDAISEYDVTSGETLGGFMLWARGHYTAERVNFSFIGHGEPLVPQTNLDFGGLLTETTKSKVATLNPLPTRIHANPSVTDHHAPMTGSINLITPFALHTAMKIGTQDGANPIDVLDLLHCFAASIEELYEVSGDFAAGDLYVSYTVASSSYAFFDPAMPGAVLELIDGHLASAEDMAWKVGYIYDKYHPENGHPHVLMVIDNAQLPLLYTAWATLSEQLLAEFDADPVLTLSRLDQVYNSSRKFDSSYCQQDWELAPPDAVSNLKDFVFRMRVGPNNFSHNSVISETSYQLTSSDIYDVVLYQFASDGVPWFADGVTETWDMTTFRGIGMFTPFQTVNLSGTDYLPWQSLYYTYTQAITLSGGTVISNPHPFAFITPDAPATKTWADVMARYWAEKSLRPGVDVGTSFCGVELLDYDAVLADLEMAVEVSAEFIPLNQPLTTSIHITNLQGITATGITITYQMPLELTFDHSEPAGVCTVLTDSVACAVDDMAAGAAQMLEIVALVTAGKAAVDADVEGFVMVSAETHDPIVRQEVYTTTTHIVTTPTVLHGLRADVTQTEAPVAVAGLITVGLLSCGVVWRRRVQRRAFF